MVRLFGANPLGGDLLIASVYMPGTSIEPRTDKLAGAIAFAEAENIPIILGCDANAHHNVWGSTDINPRGTKLLQFIAGSDLGILNKGRVPTFVTKNRKEVLDITLASNGLIDQVQSWKVSEDCSFSDHRYVRFVLSSNHSKVVKYRNPRKTNWDQYRNFLRQHVHTKLASVLPRSPDELNEAVSNITNLITGAYKSPMSPERKSRPKDNKMLWNASIEEWRGKARKS